MTFPKIKKKFIFAAFAVVILAVVVFFLFYKFGFVRYYELKKQTGKLKEEVRTVDTLNYSLQAEIDSLKTRDSKIEKVAREKYNMVRKGEKVLKVEEK